MLRSWDVDDNMMASTANINTTTFEAKAVVAVRFRAQQLLRTQEACGHLGKRVRAIN